MFRTLEFTAWGLKTSTGVTGFRLISTQGIEMVELSATSRSLLLGRKSVALLRIALEHVYTPYLAARALDRLEVWLLGYRVLLAQLVDALSCVQLGDVIASFKMYWKIALVSYLFYFSSLMVLKGEYKTVAVILILSWILKSPTFQLSCKGRLLNLAA